MNEFSIVMQGPYNEGTYSHLVNALKYSSDVILSTWQGSIPKLDQSILSELGIKVVFSEDPGSIIGYKHFNVAKYLNIKRQIIGSINGIKFARNNIVIKSRTDISLDFKIMQDIWINSKKKFGALNPTTVCPTRFLGYPYLYHISDWCHIGYKNDFLDNLDEGIMESEFVLLDPIKINGMEWHTRLSAEQILALILSSYDYIDRCYNKSNYQEYDAIDLQAHQSVLNLFANIDKKIVKMKSSKYSGKSSSWYMHDNINFSDNHKLKFAPTQLIYCLVSKFYVR